MILLIVAGIIWKMQFLMEEFHLTRPMGWLHLNIMARIQDSTRSSIRECLTTLPLPWRSFLRPTKALKASHPWWMLVVGLELSLTPSSLNTLQLRALTLICPTSLRMPHLIPVTTLSYVYCQHLDDLGGCSNAPLLVQNCLIMILDWIWWRWIMIAGVEHVGGDMFVSVPKADAVFMKVSFFQSIGTTMPPTPFHSLAFY